MGTKKEFGEGYIFTICNYICWFLLGSLYFLLLNIPLVITIIVAASYPSGMATPLFLSCIPVGPAYCALLSAMGKLVREKDVRMTREFFKAYKTNFVQSLIVWMIELACFFVLFIDVRFFSARMPISKYFFYFVAIVIFSIGLYVYPMISRFYMKTRNIIKLSFYYTMRSVKTTFFSLCSFILYGYILYKVPSIVSLFLISVVCYYIMYLENGVLKEIEEKLQPEPGSQTNTENE